MIYYGRQNINAKDIQSVVDVLNSDFLTQGPVLEQFEKKVAEYCGAKYAVAVTNATSALHIACRAAGLGEGDTLWTSPITFTASARAKRARSSMPPCRRPWTTARRLQSLRSLYH